MLAAAENYSAQLLQRRRQRVDLRDCYCRWTWRQDREAKNFSSASESFAKANYFDIDRVQRLNKTRVERCLKMVDE